MTKKFIVIDKEKKGNEVFVVIDKEKKEIIRMGQAHRSALADEKIQPNEHLIFESDDILTPDSIEIVKRSFTQRSIVTIYEYTPQKLVLSEFPAPPAPAPPAPSEKEKLKEKIKATPKAINLNELIELVEDIKNYLTIE